MISDRKIDVNRARAETPGVDHVTHFNNAGAALIPLPVLDAVIGHLHLEARTGATRRKRRPPARSRAPMTRWRPC
jgi:cysteine desulfurase / selenocysteine lyase